MTQHILITGGNRGIGLSLIQAFIANRDQVTVLCRQASEALTSTAAKVIEGVDVTGPLCNIVTQFEDQSVDILINNAGILTDENLVHFDEGAEQRILKQFEVNALAPLKISAAFLPKIKHGGKIALITSRMGSIADNDSGGRYGYRMSKCALNAAGKSLALDLQEIPISVGIFHPGWVQTDMTGQTGHLSADESANLLFQRIQDLSPNTSGKFFHANGETLPW